MPLNQGLRQFNSGDLLPGAARYWFYPSPNLALLEID